MKAKDSNTRYIPATKWNDYHPWPSIGGLRFLIFNRRDNGFDKVIKKASGRILIDETAFFKWVKDKDELAD